MIEPRIEIKTGMDMQQELTTIITQELEDIRQATNRYIGDIPRLKKEIVTMYTDANPSLEEKPGNVILLENSVGLTAELHRGQERDSGDEFAVHGLQAGQIAAVLEADPQTIVASNLHDSKEKRLKRNLAHKQNLRRGNEVAEKIYQTFSYTPQQCAEILWLINQVTAYPLENSALKKYFLNLSIAINAQYDPRLYIVRFSDGATNILTAGHLKSKNGVSPEQRRENVIINAEMLLPFAYEIDRIYKPEFKAFDFLVDILRQQNMITPIIENIINNLKEQKTTPSIRQPSYSLERLAYRG